MTDEQAVREDLECVAHNLAIAPQMMGLAAKALVLLDAKDAEYRRLAGNLDNICQAKAGVEARAEQAEARVAYLEKRLEVAPGWSEDCDGIACRDDTIKLLDERYAEMRSKLEQAEAERDEALADLKDCARGWQDHHAKYKAQAEAALAEERKAMSEAAQGALDAMAGEQWDEAEKLLSPFILPAKPADPLEAVVNEAWGWRNPHPDVTANLRAAIERAGGTISFEGEG